VARSGRHVCADAGLARADGRHAHAGALRRRDWLFERKFDGIRLLAYKTATTSRSSRATGCRSTSSLASAIASFPVNDVILDGEVDVGRPQRYHVFDILWLNGTAVTALPLEDRRALLQQLAVRAAAASRRAARRRRALGAREPRRLGRRHRQAPRLAVRASPLEALAQDEVRALAGASSSAGSPTRRARASARALLRRLLRRRRLRFAGKIGTGFDTKLLLDLRNASTRSNRRRRRSQGATAAAPARPLGQPADRRPGRVLEWTVHGKLRHPRLSACVFDKTPATSVREQP
jgi:bifunctional non-homologous end joining protein LigD